MARPAYHDAESTAKARLKEAFWELLSESDYGRITVKRMAALAHVNPNTFYYHYTSIDDLAFDALNDEKLYEIPSIIREKLAPNAHISLSESLEYVMIGERWKRIRLFITSDSTILHQHFYHTLEQFWLSLIGIDKRTLSEADYLDLTFILHGAISIIQHQTEHYNFNFIKSMPDRALGQGILQTLEDLIRKYQA